MTATFFETFGMLPQDVSSAEPLLTGRVKGMSSKELLHLLNTGGYSDEVELLQRESRKYFIQRTLEYVPFSCVLKDAAGNIVWFNRKAASLAGVTCIPNRAIRLVPSVNRKPSWPFDTDTFYKDDMEVIHNGRPILNSKRMVDVNGVDTLVRIDKIPYRDMEGNIVGFLVLTISCSENQEVLRRYKNKIKFLVYNDKLAQTYLNSNMAQKLHTSKDK